MDLPGRVANVAMGRNAWANTLDLRDTDFWRRRRNLLGRCERNDFDDLNDRFKPPYRGPNLRRRKHKRQTNKPIGNSLLSHSAHGQERRRCPGHPQPDRSRKLPLTTAPACTRFFLTAHGCSARPSRPQPWDWPQTKPPTNQTALFYRVCNNFYGLCNFPLGKYFLRASLRALTSWRSGSPLLLQPR